MKKLIVIFAVFMSISLQAAEFDSKEAAKDMLKLIKETERLLGKGFYRR